MARRIIKHIRASPEIREIINFIRAKHIMMGRKPPKTSAITRAIAKRINREDLLKDEVIGL